MPNWTSNTLELRSRNAKALRDAIALVRNNKQPLDFNKVIPVPKELLSPELHTYGGEKKEHQDMARKDAINDFGYSNSLDFCIDKWGTKWNACEVSISKVATNNDIHNVYYNFDTAWSPPIPLITEWSIKFPDVEFILDATEEGHMFNPFTMVIKNGNIESEVEHEPEENDE